MTVATDLDHDAASRTGLHWALLLRFVLALLGLGGVLILAGGPPGPPDPRFWGDDCDAAARGDCGGCEAT